MNGGSLGVNGNNDATTVVRGETVPANSEVDKECLVLTQKKQIKYILQRFFEIFIWDFYT